MQICRNHFSICSFVNNLILVSTKKSKLIQINNVFPFNSFFCPLYKINGDSLLIGKKEWQTSSITYYAQNLVRYFESSTISSKLIIMLLYFFNKFHYLNISLLLLELIGNPFFNIPKFFANILILLGIPLFEYKSTIMRVG